MKTSDKPPPESYLDNYRVAYHLYKNADIARDIARLVKPKEEQNADEPRSTTRE